MQKALAITIVVASAQCGFAQGYVRNVNNVTGFLRAFVFGLDPADPFTEKSGQTATDVPSGSTTYGGPALAGTGWTVQLWGTGGTTTDANALSFAVLGQSTFRTGSAAGIWTETTAAIPNAAGGAGSHATAQIRVWDNRGGTVTDWATASAMWRAGFIAAGTSPLFGIDNLGVDDATAALMMNLVSFQLTEPLPVPEPSTIPLGVAGGIVLLSVRRLRKECGLVRSCGAKEGVIRHGRAARAQARP
jgi:hypothetical protein